MILNVSLAFCVLIPDLDTLRKLEYSKDSCGCQQTFIHGCVFITRLVSLPLSIH